MREGTYTKITDKAYSVIVSVVFVSYANSRDKSVFSIVKH